MLEQRRSDCRLSPSLAMKRYKLTYADRYCPAQCNGTHILEADSLESARTLAKDWLIAHGGTEGLSWSVTQL
jgi:hypothetical protein